jgi:hypothetical protein
VTPRFTSALCRNKEASPPQDRVESGIPTFNTAERRQMKGGPRDHPCSPSASQARQRSTGATSIADLFQVRGSRCFSEPLLRFLSPPCLKARSLRISCSLSPESRPLYRLRKKHDCQEPPFRQEFLLKYPPKNKFFVCILLMPKSGARRQKFRFSSFRGIVR